MSDKAEDNRHLDIVLVSQTIANHYEEFRIGQDIAFMQEALRQMYDRAFATGYAAAQADCEAKVRTTVEATIAEAITANCKWCREGYELDRHETTGYPYHVIEDWDDDYPECHSAEIRALDASAIVTHIMGKEEGAE